MPDLAGALKDEIRRLAKKEVKNETAATKHAVAQYRREIASLKRQLQQQERNISFLQNQERKSASKTPRPKRRPSRRPKVSASPPAR